MLKSIEYSSDWQTFIVMTHSPFSCD